VTKYLSYLFYQLPILPLKLAALVGNRNTFLQKSSLDYTNRDTSHFYQKTVSNISCILC
jgi:hypothetical protein